MTMRHLLPIASLLILAATAHGQIPTCPSQGPVLSVTGQRLGDAWSVGLSGLPNAPAIIAVDSAPGPATTPLGTACVGLSPALATFPLTLSPAGTFSTGGTLPLVAPWLAGSSVYVQAAAADPSLPLGAGSSNGWAVTFRPPLLGVFKNAVNLPLTIGSYVAVDTVTDTVVTNVPSWIFAVHLIERVPRLGWFGFRSANGVKFIDDFTGAQTLFVPGVLPGSQYIGPSQYIAMSSDGSLMFVTQWVNFVTTVAAYGLPSGTLTGTTSIPAVTGIYPVPGTALAYLGDVDRFRVFDGATGAIVATVVLTSPLVGVKPLFVGNILYAQTNAGFVAIDATTHTVVSGPVAPAQPETLAAYGPGFVGPALHTFGGNATAGYTLIERSPVTFAVQNVVNLAGQPLSMVLSAGGTEWLIEVIPPGAAQADLQTLNPLTSQFGSAITAIVAGSTTVIRSNTQTKAYVLLSPSTLVSFPTDPVGAASPPIPLPVAAPQLRLLSN